MYVVYRQCNSYSLKVGVFLCCPLTPSVFVLQGTIGHRFIRGCDSKRQTKYAQIMTPQCTSRILKSLIEKLFCVQVVLLRFLVGKKDFGFWNMEAWENETLFNKLLVSQHQHRQTHIRYCVYRVYTYTQPTSLFLWFTVYLFIYIYDNTLTWIIIAIYTYI